MHNHVVIGAGGLLTGHSKLPSNLHIRHLDSQKIDKWSKENKKVVCFGTGTNTQFNNSKRPLNKDNGQILSDLFGLSQWIMLRGRHDISRLASFSTSEDSKKFLFQPCPSLFIQNLYGTISAPSDRVAISLPFSTLLKAENYKSHPINKFLDYCSAEGLSPVLFDNHFADINAYCFDLFQNFSHQPEHLTIINDALAIQQETFSHLNKPTLVGNSIGKIYRDIWSTYTATTALSDRFNGYRFAFGNRLHAFLPFMAFDTPSLFLANGDIRRTLPVEYFDDPVFGAPVRLGAGIMDDLVDGMISRLKFFIKEEYMLRELIREKREQLWSTTMANKSRVIDSMLS